jgi:hypothetical protein
MLWLRQYDSFAKQPRSIHKWNSVMIDVAPLEHPTRQSFGAASPPKTIPIQPRKMKIVAHTVASPFHAQRIRLPKAPEGWRPSSVAALRRVDTPGRFAWSEAAEIRASVLERGSVTRSSFANPDSVEIRHRSLTAMLLRLTESRSIPSARPTSVPSIARADIPSARDRLRNRSGRWQES